MHQKGILTISNPTANVTYSIRAESPPPTTHTVTYTYKYGTTSDEHITLIINDEEVAINPAVSGTYNNVSKIIFYNDDNPLFVQVNGNVVCDQFAGSYELNLTGDISIDYHGPAYYLAVMSGTSTLANLTGTNWTMTSYATANTYGEYNITGTISGYDYSAKQTRTIAYSSSGKAFILRLSPYNACRAFLVNDGSTGQYIFCYQNYGSDNGWRYHAASGTNTSFAAPSLNITGGTDATNPEVINWIITNAKRST